MKYLRSFFSIKAIIIANSFQNAASKPQNTSVFSILLLTNPEARSSNKNRQVTANMGCYECVLVRASLSLYRVYDQGLSTISPYWILQLLSQKKAEADLGFWAKAQPNLFPSEPLYLLHRLTNIRHVACQRCLRDRSSHFTFETVFLRIFRMSTHSENHWLQLLKPKKLSFYMEQLLVRSCTPKLSSSQVNNLRSYMVKYERYHDMISFLCKSMFQ